MIKIFVIQAALLLVSIHAYAETFQAGFGIAKQRLNTGSFQSSTSESRGHFDFTSLELRAAFIFVNNKNVSLGLESQFHRSLQTQDSLTEALDFQELAFSLTANLKVREKIGIEVGGTFFALVTAPKKEMENPGGVGVLYGLTYLLDEDWQLRLRREDKFLANSYDIQPGYSLSASYLF